MPKEVPYPSDPRVTCACGRHVTMYWNGGELDRSECDCGRIYIGEHRGTVMIIREPGERSDDD